MRQRLLSVVIPSYNTARFVGEAIGSVAAQRYRPLELIVVDDGSCDDSRAVIRDACAQARTLERVVLVEQTNGGAHAAIMRGLSLARGELLSILNSDDAYHAERFARLVPCLDERHELAFSGVEFIDAEGAPLPAGNAWPAWYEQALRASERCLTVGFALLLHNFSVSSGNFLFTRELYERLGGFSSHRFVHDWDFLLRATYYVEPVFLPAPLLRYRAHDGNTSESVRELLRQEATEAVRGYRELCAADRPPNPLAPCSANWPRFFASFAARERPFFAPDETLHQFFAGLTAAAESGASSRWRTEGT